MSEKDAGVALRDHFTFVGEILTADKLRAYKHLIGYPVPTVELTGRIYKALERMWDGRNSVYNASFNSPSDKDDWLNYRRKKLRSTVRWKTEGFETMKSRINSFVVVDLPAEQSGVLPEPYFYFVSTDDVVDFVSDDGVTIDWIIWHGRDRKHLYYVDKERYRTYELDGATDRQIKGEAIVDSLHGLDYTPARTFWTTPLDYREPFVKESPLSHQLNALDMYLFYHVGKEHLNTYGRWPIVSTFKPDCEYVDEETGQHCDNGHLRAADGYYIKDAYGPRQCPICANKRFGGPGSIIEVPVPSEENNNADLRNPVSIQSPDVVALNYNNADLVDREQRIYRSVTGWQSDPVNDQAVNEKQIGAMFESLETHLKEIQANFEQVISWVDETVCRLRYNTFEDVSVDLGTEHFILTPETILEMYTQALEKGAGSEVLDMLQDHYFATAYRNNPEKAQRHNLLAQIEPLRHKTMQEARQLLLDGATSQLAYVVKANFSSFIQRFERENEDITSFMKEADYSRKIDAIGAVIEGYAEQVIAQSVRLQDAAGTATM